jgi:hypothetical protein
MRVEKIAHHHAGGAATRVAVGQPERDTKSVYPFSPARLKRLII